MVVAFSLGKRDRRRARAAARQSLVIMTLFAVVLAVVIHYFGSEIINIVAGEATPEVQEAMAGVGLADSFNMVIMAFFAAELSGCGNCANR